MAVSISGLSSGLNWQQIVTELVAADSAGMNQVQAQQTNVNMKQTAVSALSTDLTTVENDIFNLENPNIYGEITGASTTTGSTWQVNPLTGTPAGTYKIAVSQLATATQLTGANNISQTLAPSPDVSGVTLATMATATPPTAGVFTVNGQQISVTTSESLADIFAAITTATGGAVSGSYDNGTDKVTLSSTSGSLTLGAANDTSNLLQALRLSNTGGASSTSTAKLGALSTTAALNSAQLATPLTGLDGSGNGTFSINGVSISYNATSDTLSTVIGKINNSSAGVSASYDAQDNQMILTNTTTGDTAINVSDTSGNLMSALGLTGAGSSVSYGKNALFSVNGGPTKTSTSNVLTSAALGVTGLNVTVNTEDTQSVQVTTDTTAMAAAVQSFLADFNTFEGDVTTATQITTVNGSTVTSLLSSEHEVSDWGRQLEDTVFGAGTGSSSGIDGLDGMGIDFNGTTGQLKVSDSAKLAQALSANPQGVKAFFTTASTGFGSVVNKAINDVLGQMTATNNSLQAQSKSLGNQITTMQTQLDAETTRLDNEFTQMETIYAQMQSESSTLSGLSLGTSSSSSSSSSSSGSTASISKGTVSGS